MDLGFGLDVNISSHVHNVRVNLHGFSATSFQPLKRLVFFAVAPCSLLIFRIIPHKLLCVINKTL